MASWVHELGGRVGTTAMQRWAESRYTSPEAQNGSRTVCAGRTEAAPGEGNAHSRQVGLLLLPARPPPRPPPTVVVDTLS